MTAARLLSGWATAALTILAGIGLCALGHRINHPKGGQ